MARRSAMGANDGIIAERFARLAHAFRSVDQMAPVKPQIGNHAKMRGQNNRHIPRMAGLPQDVGRVGNFTRVAGCKRQAETGDIDAIQNASKLRVEVLKVKRGGGYQIDLWLIGAL